MASDFKEYLQEIKFEKYLSKLKKKIEGKSVVIYGCGTLFQYIFENYDLNPMNIIGISDGKFLDNQENDECFGFKIVPKNKIKSLNPDVVLVCAMQYIEIVEDLILNQFSDTNIKVYPLARVSFLELIKRIWRA